jgi:hypothetical protein
MAQAVHRAFSFGTLAFLIIHIVTEILAQRSHVIDAVVPFLRRTGPSTSGSVRSPPISSSCSW